MSNTVRAEGKAIHRRLRGVLDRRVTEPRRVAGALAATVAGAVTIGAATSSRRVRALCYGTASAIGVGVPLRHMLEAERELRQELRDLWGLSHVMVDGTPWPPPGGWALGADAIAWLLREMRSRGSRVVVELGPGTSSIVLAHGGGMDLEMYGIEHDERFVETVAKQLMLNGVDAYRLVHVPLKTCMHEQRAVQWYEERILDVLPPRIDVLIVDGPPNWSGSSNRSPAWAELGDRMRDGAVIVVDDTHRADERDMVDRWLASGDLQLLHDGASFMALEVRRAPPEPSGSGSSSRARVA
jgi:Methyltransferase domain